MNQGFHRSQLSLVLIDEKLDQDMAGMASSPSLTFLGDLLYGRQITHFNGGPYVRLIHLITFADHILAVIIKIVQSLVPRNSWR